MNTLKSTDGTLIAYDVTGNGPALIIVTGALSTRSFGSMPELVRLLTENFTVYNYDRRSRGDSGDTQPYTVEREIEDIAALIDIAGGSAYIYGHSSGAALALEAAATLGRDKISKLAIYEAPYGDMDSDEVSWKDYGAQLQALLSEGKNGDAVALFLQTVGVPAEQVAGMRHAPFWAYFEAMAPTLAYEYAVLGTSGKVEIDKMKAIESDCLVCNGTNGDPSMQTVALQLVEAIPNATHTVLKDQAHNVDNEAIVPVLKQFFNSISE